MAALGEPLREFTITPKELPLPSPAKMPTVAPKLPQPLVPA